MDTPPVEPGRRARGRRIAAAGGIGALSMASKPPAESKAAKPTKSAKATATAKPKPVPGWKLVWHDEFEGTQVDRSKWDFDIGNGFYDYKNHAWVPGWGNEELQYYTDAPENASVKDGLLTIRAVKESLHGCGYTSARLKTRRRDGTALFTTLYGRCLLYTSRCV